MGVVGRSQGFLHISEPLLKPGALIGMSPARRPWRSQYQNWKVSRRVIQLPTLVRYMQLCVVRGICNIYSVHTT
ncbi:hypothetical protein PspLS_05560 [Pyricularia sp. CBS 133598]|nr:hypothetical protein PspLS_05560 [Pyricularia sp. CBS 133598]